MPGQEGLTAAALPTQAFLCRRATERIDRMRSTSSLVTALAVTMLGFLAVPAQAAPATGPAGNLKPAAGENALVEQVRHRCYWRHGHLRCPRHRYRRHYYAPGFRFYFGPQRHHHRHWRHHHRRHGRH
jgi:hypothetical protein